MRTSHKWINQLISLHKSESMAFMNYTAAISFWTVVEVVSVAMAWRALGSGLLQRHTQAHANNLASYSVLYRIHGLLPSIYFKQQTQTARRQTLAGTRKAGPPFKNLEQFLSNVCSVLQ